MKRLNSILEGLGTLLVIIAASIVIWRQFAPAVPPATTRPLVQNVSGAIPADLLATVRGEGQVALVEFADFQCPFCAKYAREVEPTIQADFLDTGVIRQAFVNFPLPNHVRAEPASEAALCAHRQEKFWEMRDALFRSPMSLEDDDLAARARDVGLDLEEFERCLVSGESRPIIERHKSAARDFGVKSTPVFLLGIVQPDGSVALKKRLNGALPYIEFRDAILEVAPSELRSFRV